MKHTHTFTSERTGALEQRYLAVEPCSSPPSGPLVLDGNCELHPMTSVAFSVEVDAPI
jgi:hypothetical protein